MADTGRKQRIGRPPTVSREEIIKAALGEGISKFSMLSVATRLNMTHGALYRYFPSRDELAIAAVDTVIERACWDDTATQWRELLTGYARSLWSLCQAAPGLAECALNLPRDSQAMSRIVDKYVRRLSQCGVRREDATVAVGLITEGALLSSLLPRRGDAHRTTAAKDATLEETSELGGLAQKLALILDGVAHRLTC